MSTAKGSTALDNINSDDYTRRTRPLMARVSLWVTLLYGVALAGKLSVCCQRQHGLTWV